MNELSIRNPYTGEADATLRLPDAAVLDRRVGSLRAAQAAWEAAGLEHRFEVLGRFAAAVEKRRPAIAAALSADTGRDRVSRMEIDGIGESIGRWQKVAAGVLSPRSGRSGMLDTVHYCSEAVPYPVVGVISPWNFPVSLSLIDTIPALVAGCAVAVKPSEVTPRFVEPLAEAIADVSELRDVLALVPGDGGTGAEVVDRVDLVCFTGSVATGRRVGERCMRRFIPCFLELGGKDPALVLEDADVDRAARAILRGSVINSGQACQSLERVYVARSLHDAFAARLTALARNVPINWPDRAAGILGPIIAERQIAVIEEQLRDARDGGAVATAGGEIEWHGGAWLRPTVLTGVHHGMKIMNEETFGPIIPVMPFDSDEEAVHYANRGSYGLSAAIFSGDAERARAVARRIEAGAVSINDASLTSLVWEAEKTSFKLSGLGGSRMGPASLLRFVRRRALLENDAEVVGIEAFREGSA